MRSRYFLRGAARLALAGAAALSLAACGVRPADPATIPGGAPTAAATGAPGVAPTTAPAGAPTAAATAAPSSIPTAAATAAPTAAATAAPLPGLIGPEWTKIVEGDFDRNERADVVAFKPAAVASQVSTENGHLASEIVIVERRADGAPAVRLLITRDGVSADGRPIASFGTGDARPAGMVVRLFAGERKLVLTQLNGAGQQYAQDVAVGYAEAQGAYIVYGPGGSLPAPLVGPEWTVLAAGDFNGNGAEDVVAYKASSAVPRVGGCGGPGFGAIAREVVVAERAPSGGVAVRLLADTATVRADGQLFRTFPTPAGGLLVFGDAGVLELHPFSAEGALLDGAMKLTWGPDGRIVELGTSAPDDRIEVGPEWQFLDQSDRTRDGRTDAVIYIPSSLPVSMTPGLTEAAASEVAIVQRGAAGTDYLASVAQGAVYAGGYLVYTFGDGGGAVPAGYVVSVEGDLVVIKGVNADGTLSGQAVGLSWEPSVGAFTATPR